MNRNNGPTWRRLALHGALACALLAAAALAQAQYIWLDEKGLRQYSDRPPPPSVPLKRILKAPGLAQQQEAAEDAGAATETGAAAAAGGASAKTAPTTAERNAAFIKRQGEQANLSRKTEEEARRKADLAANCEAQRKNKALLESGMRVSTVEANGERGFLSEEERARQLKAAQRALADCK